MTKKINTTQELINRASKLGIETNGKTIQEIGQNLIDKLMTYYDKYTCYIDDYKQMKEAEASNDEIEVEVKNIKELINNENVKENKTMKKDYTLNGKLTATTWKEFREEMKKAGINPATKTYVQLVEEYNALSNKDIIVPVGDMSSDKYDNTINKPKTTITIKQKDGDFLIKNIYKASFVATKGESKGKRILTMKKLFGIIKQAYGGKNNIEDTFIRDIINQLVSLQYISFKKYESGAMIFYPTIKTRDYVKGGAR